MRVTASGDRAVSGSEKLIFRLGNQNAANQFPQYMGGALDFGKDGKLYVSTGDNDTPEKAQQTTNLFGKMLRIDKSGTIPSEQPLLHNGLWQEPGHLGSGPAQPLQVRHPARHGHHLHKRRGGEHQGGD